MRILKFGGSSVGTPERISDVIEILGGYQKNNIGFGVVFSAFQGVTDKLIALSKKTVGRNDSYLDELEQLKQVHFTAVDFLMKNKKDKVALGKKVITLMMQLEEILHGVYLVKELTPRTLDYIMSFGERLSCSIISEVMNVRGFDTEFLDARRLVRTDDNFGSARVNFTATDKNIREYFEQHQKIQVITGFIGVTDKDETSTLGRGGSDYTAAIFGAALDAEEIEIWTDVDGILTADPRKVSDAFSLAAVTYEEAMELSHFGAKVIHFPTMKPAMNKKIKIRIKNTFNPSHEGTVIADKDDSRAFSVKGISSIDDITVLRITGSGMVGVVGIAARIFGALAKESINVILITQASSEHSICIAVLPTAGIQAKNVIEEEFKWEIRDGMIDEILVEPEMSIIAVVGEDLRHTPGISGKVFQSLGKNGINTIATAQGSSELNISLVIQKTYLKKALNVLHDSLFLSRKKTLNLFVVGPGLVGSAFLKLLVDRKSYIENQLHSKIRIIGLMDINGMLFNDKGIGLQNWKEEFAQSSLPPDMESFIGKIKEMNLPHSILVDCTASEFIVGYYQKILCSSISIVTPNKIANTQSYERYLALRESAKKFNVEFRYGCNVGAAMPVISTLKDLIANGDEVIKIEGVFSGTLSFIFNMLKGNGNFSDIVKTAQEKGYTEPDPRDDLKGLDMARKLLILIRESGIQFELEDIKIEKLISEEAEKAPSLEEFYRILEKDDGKFADRNKKASEKDSVLSYIACYENGKAKLSIEEIGGNHPFSNLTECENIVAFTTKNYSQNPLVIRGPGAGADFTAGGILADILRISNYLG
jgi:bifunctional aspartokinase / homoserine dehydrogenase 1